MKDFWAIVAFVSLIGFVFTLIAAIFHAVGNHNIHQSWEAAAIYAFISIGLGVLTSIGAATFAQLDDRS